MSSDGSLDSLAEDDDGAFVSAPQATEDTVAGYLVAHPDFFERRPEVTESIQLTHPVGGAVSLIEYQLRLVKESNEDLRLRLKNLVANARDNEDIGRRVHRLCLYLLQCNGVDEIFGRLYQRLADEFLAEFAAVRVFVPPRDSGDSRLGEFAPLAPAGASRLRQALEAGKPLCGKLDSPLLALLFDERTDDIRSGALVPLGVRARFGVLAMASRSPDRFRRGTGTLFLQQIGEIASHALSPFLAED